ncbi:hypothetical protein HPP92_003658 [Vanilla planifolia]|uniref:Secreted protein n=1 Tax=Vanilla planifolia TaxID=51239 RepID=A0A835VG49_VANPL|nr:hypothetical protein HPP92_004110 [Vanilla planifolia]KAG0503586.1 hypothetical protein HPP92_003658 [Vanilla planifolia]
MANMRHSCAFLVLLLFGHECILSCEGRHLNDEKLVCSRCLEEMIDGLPEADGSEEQVVTQDSRPSVPGHSPGVGHSLQRHSVGKNV